MHEPPASARRAALSTALVALALAACAAAPAATPRRVAPATFESVRGICVLPLRSEVHDPPRVAGFETLLVESLRQRGFRVVGATETTEAFDRIRREEGGTYDVATGERDEGLYAAASRRVRARLGQELPCEALLTPRIVYVTAPWLPGILLSDGVASWDGARVSFYGPPNREHAIGALSLHVRITDLDERELFFGAGGIRPISSVTWQSFGNRLEPIEPTELLADEDLDRTAIELALEPLPRRATP